MPSLPVRCLLFLSSYTPLLLILGIRAWSAHRSWALAFSAAGAVATFVLYIYLALVRRRMSKTLLQVECASSRDAEAMSYIASYVIPFLVDPFTDVSQTLSLAVFFIILGVIYVNSNMVHINPMLSLRGLHILEVEAGGQARTIITKRRFIARGSSVHACTLGDDIFLEIKS